MSANMLVPLPVWIAAVPSETQDPAVLLAIRSAICHFQNR